MAEIIILSECKRVSRPYDTRRLSVKERECVEKLITVLRMADKQTVDTFTRTVVAMTTAVLDLKQGKT